jgi:hypothetical protein
MAIDQQAHMRRNKEPRKEGRKDEKRKSVSVKAKKLKKLKIDRRRIPLPRQYSSACK